jgi:hypothetical protein
MLLENQPPETTKMAARTKSRWLSLISGEVALGLLSDLYAVKGRTHGFLFLFFFSTLLVACHDPEDFNLSIVNDSSEIRYQDGPVVNQRSFDIQWYALLPPSSTRPPPWGVTRRDLLWQWLDPGFGSLRSVCPENCS